MRFALAVLLGTLTGATRLAADGPGDNIPEKVRPIPPAGSKVADADLAELKTGLDELRAAIDAIPKLFGTEHPLTKLLPDVEVYHKAVRYAVELNTLYVEKGRDDVAAAKLLLKQGKERAAALAAGKAPWATQTGLVVRGYRSKIDGSVQPYGLVVPKDYDPRAKAGHRLDFWWHGRGEKLTEVDFIRGRQTSPGEFTPAGAFVLHPYGRYCNANKFAGEIDTLECYEHVRLNYRIDQTRVVARGFSMGGAACWQFAVHYPTLWAAAAPGAGFAETPEFLNNFQGETVQPTWYEKRLWHWYNATDHAQNIFNLPTVAYSGEIDKQKQAADVMAREMKKVGLDLVHVIGPKTGHSYEKGAKAEVNKLVDEIVAKGRDGARKEVKFVTYTLRYNDCDLVRLYGLERHWRPATVHAVVADGKMSVTTTNVTELAVYPRLPLQPERGAEKEFPNGRLTVTLDGTDVSFDRGAALFGAYKSDGKWIRGLLPRTSVGKQTGIQGPIDDAFLSRFVMVRPTGTPLNEKVGAWAAAEMKHAVDHWKLHFRGDAVVKDDTAVTDEEINGANLILWGDPSSNKFLARIADKLPIKWSKERIEVFDKAYNPAMHVPVLIYPNPLSPAKYVVLNSGFTFREYDYLNNARQVPKLPDYAVLDVTTPPNSRYPGKVVRAGFFGEKWELLPDDGK